MPVSPAVTLSASEAGAVAMSIEMKLRCNARLFKRWNGARGKAELKERAFLDEPGTRRFCFDRQLEVRIYSLLRCVAECDAILQTVMNCAFLNSLTLALSRRERGQKPQSVPVSSISMGESQQPG